MQSRRKRESIHPVQSEWPRGVRKRGWGWLHDQIWNKVLPGDSDFHILESLRVFSEQAWFRVDGRLRWYRRDQDTGIWYRVYMDRKMIWLPRWLGGLKLRLHEFLLGDDDSAPHDHPWWFVTFPLDTYEETVETRRPFGFSGWRDGHVTPVALVRDEEGQRWVWERTVRTVRRFRFHFRPALYRHFVHEHPSKFVRTIVVTGPVRRTWGFWPKADSFVPYTEWARYD